MSQEITRNKFHRHKNKKNVCSEEWTIWSIEWEHWTWT